MDAYHQQRVNEFAFSSEKVKDHFNRIANKREEYKRKNSYYHNYIQNFCRFHITENSKVLELGCGTGDLLKSVKPLEGVGIDISDEMIKIAKKKNPKLNFILGDVHNIKLQTKFDYILMTDLIGDLGDIQKVCEELNKVIIDETRIIITYYNYLWEPILILAEKLGLKTPHPPQNWLSMGDIQNLIRISGLDVVKKGHLLLLPINIPLLSDFVNKFIARLPLIKHLCLTQYFIVRKSPSSIDRDYSVSVIIPARNEEGNIENAILRTPNLGSNMEFVFVEGNSKDNTIAEIKRVQEKYKGRKSIILVRQGKGAGKGDAVRKGFDKASGDIIMILDADLTMPPEELPKFYQALRKRLGELVMGSRLVYPMEKEAMRFLNILGNKFFSAAFSFLLDQPIKDTLCGTKVMFRKDYLQLAQNRKYYGNFDPFGDFDLIFGAAKMDLKILEIPIRYKARTYGTTNISRFKHGWLLLKMVALATRKIKFV
jgi:ubiquinone/menaquinone biosynthesis C-methylase UbiE